MTQHLLLLRKTLKSTVRELKKLREVDLKRHTIIVNQNAVGQELAKENQKLLDDYLLKNFNGKTDEKISILSDILFRNFDIQDATIEVLKCYVDEYFDRFNLIEKNLSKTLILLDKYIQEKD